jgi:hypothetical protein
MVVMAVTAVLEGLSATVGLVVTVALELRQAQQSQSVVGLVVWVVSVLAVAVAVMVGLRRSWAAPQRLMVVLVVTVGPPETVEPEVPEVPEVTHRQTGLPPQPMGVMVVMVVLPAALEVRAVWRLRLEAGLLQPTAIPAPTIKLNNSRIGRPRCRNGRTAIGSIILELDHYPA